MKPSRDPSVFDEPHLAGGYAADPAEQRVRLREDEPLSDEEWADNNAWDEPGMQERLPGELPSGSGRFDELLTARQQEVDGITSWTATLGIALAAGPFAILAALLSGMGGMSAIAYVVVTGPVIEEVLKVGLALWVVERKPWVFRSRAQILVVGVVAAVSFASIENLVYLNIYFPDPPPQAVEWRWVVCTVMHTCCTLIAALGLAKVWHAGMVRRSRPELTAVLPWIITAAVVHGVYNAFALLLGPMFMN